MNSDEPEDLEKSLNAFKSCGNVEMCYSIAYSLGCEPEQINELTTDLVEVMVNTNRFKEAANLYVTLPNYSATQAVEYYTKGSSFMEAIKESMKAPEGDEDEENLREKCLSITKNSLTLNFDVKKN